MSDGLPETYRPEVDSDPNGDERKFSTGGMAMGSSLAAFMLANVLPNAVSIPFSIMASLVFLFGFVKVSRSLPTGLGLRRIVIRLAFAAWVVSATVTSFLVLQGFLTKGQLMLLAILTGALPSLEGAIVLSCLLPRAKRAERLALLSGFLVAAAWSAYAISVFFLIGPRSADKVPVLMKWAAVMGSQGLLATGAFMLGWRGLRRESGQVTVLAGVPSNIRRKSWRPKPRLLAVSILALLVVSGLGLNGWKQEPLLADSQTESFPDGETCVHFTTKNPPLPVVAVGLGCGERTSGGGHHSTSLSPCNDYAAIVLKSRWTVHAGSVVLRVSGDAGNPIHSQTFTGSSGEDYTAFELPFSSSYSLEATRSDDFAGMYVFGLGCRTD